MSLPEPQSEFQTLLMRASCGDKGALELLTKQYERQILVVARARLGPALRPYLDSMDLVQSVHRLMLSGFVHDRFDFSSPQRMIGLAVELLRRKVAQKWRKFRRQRRLEGSQEGISDWESAFEALASPEPDPAGSVESRDFVQQVLERLTTVDRQLLQLYIDGFSQIEIAQELKITHKAMRMRLHRLRTHLKVNGLLSDWLPRGRMGDDTSKDDG